MGIKRNLVDTKCEITEDEAALYDRQIRLWGIESQKRLREAKILLIGMGGLGAEIGKNLVLAGVKSLTLMDDKSVQPYDKTSQFLLAGCENGVKRSEASKSALSHLNPNVEVLSVCENVKAKADDFFADFNVICATETYLPDLIRLNKICRDNSIKFFSGDTWGYYGYCFLDLLQYKYISEKKVNKEIILVKKMIEFCPLEISLAYKVGKPGTGLSKRTCNVLFLMHMMNAFYDKHNRLPLPEHRTDDIEELKLIRNTVLENLGFGLDKVSDAMINNLFGNLSPVCSIIGGALSQEIIKGISGKDDPFNNFFFFDGEEFAGKIVNIGSSPSVSLSE